MIRDTSSTCACKTAATLSCADTSDCPRVEATQVCIPKACFQEKDYLCRRYHARKALYLRQLADALEAHDRLDLRGRVRVRETAFGYDDAVEVVHKDDGNREWSVRVLAVGSADAFPMGKLHPGRANLRLKGGGE